MLVCTCTRAQMQEGNILEKTRKLPTGKLICVIQATSENAPSPSASASDQHVFNHKTELKTAAGAPQFSIRQFVVTLCDTSSRLDRHPSATRAIESTVSQTSVAYPDIPIIQVSSGFCFLFFWPKKSRGPFRKVDRVWRRGCDSSAVQKPNSDARWKREKQENGRSRSRGTAAKSQKRQTIKKHYAFILRVWFTRQKYT